MRAVRASSGALQRLKPSEMSRVHSVYNSTVNLETPAGLVSLTNSTTPLHPFSIVCDVEDVRSMGFSAGHRLLWKDDEIALPSGGTLVGDAMSVEVLSMGLHAARPIRAEALRTLAAERRALALVSDLGFLIDAKAPTTFTPFKEELRAFVRGLMACDLKAVKTGASKLAGLGRGLTPSFDDFCVGYLAAQWRRGQTEWAVRVGEVLADQVKLSSNDISAEFVSWAQRGQFGERLLEVGAACGREERAMTTALRELLAMGHFSGADTSVGFFVGIGLPVDLREWE